MRWGGLGEEGRRRGGRVKRSRCEGPIHHQPFTLHPKVHTPNPEAAHPSSQFNNNYFTEMRRISEERSYLRLIDIGITRF